MLGVRDDHSTRKILRFAPPRKGGTHGIFFRVNSKFYTMRQT